MWANAQRDGRFAEYRWRHMFNAAKFGRRPLYRVPCSNTAKTQNPLKFAGVPQTLEPISAVVGLLGRSSPYYEDMWRRYCCLTSLFPIVDTCLSCKDRPIARPSCAIMRRWRIFGDFLCPVFQQAACSTFQTYAS